MRILVAAAFAGLVGCSAGAPGTTVSCDHGIADFCTQTISSSGHSAKALGADCTAVSGSVTPGCSTGSLAGTCANAMADDTTLSIYYYTPTYDSTSAEADCRSKGGTFTAR